MTITTQPRVSRRWVALFALAWVPFLGCFILLLFAQEGGPWLVLLAIKPMLAALVVAALMAVVDSLPLALSVIVKATIGAFIALGVVWLMLLRSDDHQEVQAILRSHMGLRFAK